MSAREATREFRRVPVDVAWARDLDAFVNAAIGEVPPPEELEDQAQGALAAGYHRDRGLLRYAEGAPLDEVRAAFRRATEYTLALFRLRAPREPWQPADDVDESLTNSRRALEALELALACGAHDLATALAPLVWDPPDATYIGPSSVVCTPEEQRLAYALRDLLANDGANDGASDGASDVVNMLPDTEWHTSLQRARGWALVSVAAHDSHALALAIAALREAHRAAVRARLAEIGTLDRLDLLLDVPSLAYAAFGRAHLGYVPLPDADAYFPRGLARDDQ